jgi:hypothetical protein
MCFLRQIFILLYFAKIQVELNGLGCDRKASYPKGIFDCYLYMKIEVKYEIRGNFSTFIENKTIYISKLQSHNSVYTQ